MELTREELLGSPAVLAAGAALASEPGGTAWAQDPTVDTVSVGGLRARVTF